MDIYVWGIAIVHVFVLIKCVFDWQRSALFEKIEREKSMLLKGFWRSDDRASW